MAAAAGIWRMARASHSSSSPFVLRPREGKGRGEEGETAYHERERVIRREEERKRERTMTERSREKCARGRKDARGAKIRMFVGMPLDGVYRMIQCARETEAEERKGEKVDMRR